MLIEISGVACLGKDTFTTESSNRSALFVFYHASIFCGLEGKMLPHAVLLFTTNSLCTFSAIFVRSRTRGIDDATRMCDITR